MNAPLFKESIGCMEIHCDTKRPRVLVISRCESLLGIAVESLVANEKEWMVLRTFEGENTRDLIEKINQVNPSIVIIPQDDPEIGDQFLVRMLQGNDEGRKVISLSLQENLLEVHSKRTVQITSTQDIVSEVERQLSHLYSEAKTT